MAKTTSVDSKKPRVLVGRGPAAPSPERKQALDGYGSAIRLMQDGKFDKARAAFEKLLSTAPADMAERMRVHMAACDRQLRTRDKKFATPQEQYDFAISLLNQGLYMDAREHMEAVLTKHRDADYAMYGLAVLHSMTGDADQSLKFLADAIERNPSNRIYARSDSDFQDIMDDPRFTELLYPEVQ